MTNTIPATAAVDETLARWAAQDAAYNEVVSEFRPERAPFRPYGSTGAFAAHDFVTDTEFERRYEQKLRERGLAA